MRLFARPPARLDAPPLARPFHAPPARPAQLEFEFVEATGLKKPVEERPSGHAAVYGASHATYGDAMIRVLPVVASRLLAASLRDGRQLPLATSPHLHPIWQTIVSDTQPPTAYLVQPRFDTTLDLLLKREPLDEDKAHRIFCQLAHAVECLHDQQHQHGAVLVSNVLVRENDSEGNHDARGPFALLDKAWGARRVSTEARRPPQPPETRAAAAAAAAAAAEDVALGAVTAAADAQLAQFIANPTLPDVAMPDADTPTRMRPAGVAAAAAAPQGLQRQRPSHCRAPAHRQHGARPAKRRGGGAAGGAGAIVRRASDVGVDGVRAPRLGSTSHQLDAADHDLARGGALDASYQAADIPTSAALRMLLQPHKFMPLPPTRRLAADRAAARRRRAAGAGAAAAEIPDRIPSRRAADAAPEMFTVAAAPAAARARQGPASASRVPTPVRVLEARPKQRRHARRCAVGPPPAQGLQLPFQISPRIRR